MRVIGIDLAASSASTGVVVMEGTGAGWNVRPIDREADDDELVSLAAGADAIGVDAPLGWPDDFVEAVVAHHRGDRWPGGPDRRSLTHRLTDVLTKEVVGRFPLSVSADLLGVVAMRAALLQQRWADEIWGGEPAPRDGSGVVSETYPAAAFAAWGIPCRGYKARNRPGEARAVRDTIVRQLARSTGPWLDAAAVEDVAVTDDRVLDAWVCALIALAVRSGDTDRPDETQVATARREGWIHVPTAPLNELRPPN